MEQSIELFVCITSNVYKLFNNKLSPYFLKTRRLTVRNNSDELLKRANDYFKQYPRVVITEYQPPPIIEILKKELQFYEKKNFSDQ